MGSGEVLKPEFRYSEADRPLGHFSWKFLLERLTIAGAAMPRFKVNGTASFDIACKALQDITNLRFRMEYWYRDGTKIGSMLSSPVAVVRKGDCRFRLEMDLTGLTSGQYRADLVAYTTDKNGIQELLDGVYPGIVFEVTDSPDTDHHVGWDHQYWGHVRLRDMELKLE